MKKTAVILSICLAILCAACDVQDQTTTEATWTTGQSATTTAATTAAAPTTTAMVTSTAATTTPTTVEATVPTTAETTAPTTLATTAPTTTAGYNTLSGTFQGAEWGDYLHVDIKGDDGVDYNFFVVQYPGIDVETLAIGQKLKIIWQNTDEYLDPPGETVNIDKIISLELAG